MKLLAIHSNKIFFKGTLEESVPNFYEWLAEERGYINQFIPLHEMYMQEKREGPLLLKDIYELTIGGLGLDELMAYCQKYNEFYFDNNIKGKLGKLKEDMEILIFTSYPKEIYKHLEGQGLVKIFGTEGIIGERNNIIGLNMIKLKNIDKVKGKMEEIGLDADFSLEPNRYGMLELLIDKMIEDGLSKEDVIVVGKGTTALPMHRVSARQTESLEEI